MIEIVKLNKSFSLIFLVTVSLTMIGQEGYALQNTNDQSTILQRCSNLKDTYLGTGKVILEKWESSNEVPIPNVLDIKRLQDALEGRGVELILLPIPSRAYSFADRIDKTTFSDFNFSKANYKQNWQKFIKTLNDKGINVVNILPIVDSFSRGNRNEDFYFTRDPHWTTSGAEVSAKLTTDYIANKMRGKNFTVTTSEKVVNEARGHDLTGIQNDRYRKACGINTDELVTYQVTVSDKTTSLLDDSKAEIGVFGDSFGITWPDNNFAPWLEYYSKAKVVNNSAQGGGFYGAMLGYFADPKVNASLPKFIVIPAASPIPDNKFMIDSVIATLNLCKNAVPNSKIVANINSKKIIEYSNLGISKGSVLKVSFDSQVSQFTVYKTMQDGGRPYSNIDRYYPESYKGSRTDYYIPLGDSSKIKSIQINVRDENTPAKRATINICKA